MGDKSIEDLADDAERKTGRGTKLTASELEERNDAMIRDRLRGQSWPFLAKRYELSASRCQDVFSQWREHNRSTYAGRAPIDLVHRMLDRYEAWVEQLAEIAAETGSDATAISAIQAQMSAMQKAAELCQATGILPHNLGNLRLELDVRLLAQRLITVLSEFDASIELKRAMLEALQSDAMPIASLSDGSD